MWLLRSNNSCISAVSAMFTSEESIGPNGRACVMYLRMRRRRSPLTSGL
jgi:hypothetical protein